MLVNGVWQSDWDPVQAKDEQGRFIRQSSAFRDQPSVDQAERGGYGLIAAYICPWATRCLITRDLLGLSEVLPVYIVEPQITEEGWQFAELDDGVVTTSPLAGTSKMHSLYTQSDSNYTGRATVPVLWDRENNRIVNNESADILRIFNTLLRPVHQSPYDLVPATFEAEIETFNERIYSALNNGVYRAGFASTQAAYEEAYHDVFTCLDELEAHFQHKQFAVGEQLTESDIRLFVTLIRFDVAYYGLFKTNRCRIADYPALSRYVDALLEIPAFVQNTRVDHIKQGYFSIKALNPGGIVPRGPEDLAWLAKVAS